MRTMIVDDEILSISQLKQELAMLDENVQCEGFRTAKSAMAYLEKQEVDVAFLDIEMQGMSGLELAKSIKEIQPRTNIIFVTGFSQYALEAHGLYVSGFLLKPATKEDIVIALENLRNPLPYNSTERIRVQCFGNFDVFVENHLVFFRLSMSREILAYLIDLKGASATKAEIAAILWEDGVYSRSRQQMLQELIQEMLSALKAVGAEKMVIRKRNRLSVDITQFECDAYRFEGWNLSAINAFEGEYMANYSWAEFKLGYIEQQYQKFTGNNI